MAEITKITTPMIPAENMGKHKAQSDTAIDLNDLSKVNRTQDQDRILDRQEQRSQWDSLNREMLLPLLKDAGDLTQAIGRMITLVQLGVSASDAISDPQVQALLKELFLSPEELMAALQRQTDTAVLFKGDAFDVLRDILARFEGNQRITDSLTQLLKVFDQHVNAQNSVRTILVNCANILDYMFSKDRQQFAAYLMGLEEMLLPQDPKQAAPEAPPAPPQEGEAAAQAQQAQGETAAAQAQEGTPAAPQEQVQEGKGEQAQEGRAEQAPGALPLEQKEIAQILKGNLLPLLGEIVVKYHQNDRIRDIVMVVVHNIVRLDQGTPENLQEALAKLVQELRHVANLPPSFENNMLQALLQNGSEIRGAQNEVVQNLAQAISNILHDPNANPAVLRQAEALLLSMLQNESSMMNILHFLLPMQTPMGQVLAELYVDPDSEEQAGRRGGGKHSRKVFVTFDSEYHGRFELSFVETDEKVDFSLWCPEVLVDGMGKLKRSFATIMQSHGYTMTGFAVEQLKKPQNIAQVFPHLLSRRVGIDVRV